MSLHTSNENFLIDWYNALRQYGSYFQGPVLLLMRLAWGWESMQAGWGHLRNINGTADFFRSLHIPMPVANVYIAGSTEMVGGALLIIGLGTRLVSLPFIFNFLVAIVTAGGPEILKKMKDGGLAGWNKTVDDTAFPFFILGLVMLAFGPGMLSVDYVIQRNLFPKTMSDTGGFPVKIRS